MNAGRKIWYAVDVVLREGAREAVEYALMEAGALGCEGSSVGVRQGEKHGLDQWDETVRVSGYFNALPARELVREKLLEALSLYGLSSSEVRDMALREVEERDWLDEWKKSWQPVRVGQRFVIAPPWSEVQDEPGRIVIRIEPGMAFGTGTHETTRLCLSAIEKYFTGQSFLDVGTGTGILAIAAAKLFPDARIEALDTDAEAVEIARENARLNNVAGHIDFRVGTIEEAVASAELVCANLTADVIRPLLPRLLGASCGRLILSGILDSQAEEVVQCLKELGVEACEMEADGEWVSIIV